MRWFQKSLDAGMPLAYADIGSLYIEGEGIEPNYSKAASYFQKGAELGEEWSLTALGLLYLEGNGVEKDTKKALSCFERAAMRGNKIAQSRLAKPSE
jgi:TPR repeat protein